MAGSSFESQPQNGGSMKPHKVVEVLNKDEKNLKFDVNTKRYIRYLSWKNCI